MAELDMTEGKTDYQDPAETTTDRTVTIPLEKNSTANQDMTANLSFKQKAWAWFKKYGIYILTVLATVISLGALSRRNNGQQSQATNKRLDDLDKEVIQDKIADANQVGVQIEQAQQDAETISEQGNAEMQEVKQKSESALSDSQRIADFNASMKKRKKP